MKIREKSYQGIGKHENVSKVEMGEQNDVIEIAKKIHIKHGEICPILVVT